MKQLTRAEKHLYRKFDKIRAREESGANAKRKKSSRAVAKFFSNRLAIVGLVIFSVIFLSCLFAPLITKYQAETVDLRNILKAPSGIHWFGTDKVGRDVFSRVLYGGRYSILIASLGALGGAVIGVLLGSYAGYKGGWFDKVFMRIGEALTSFPTMILNLLFVTIMGRSMRNLIIIFTITGWVGIFRLARATMLSIREEEYVQALHAFGLNDAIICFKHMLPNALAPIIVNITINMASMILEEAALSFLGLGVPMQIPTWGNILNASQDMYTLEKAWWMWAPVGTTITLFVMSINFIGDGIRDMTDTSVQG